MRHTRTRRWISESRDGRGLDHHDGVLIGVHPFFTFIPSGLRCSACGLELLGRDEMDAAGITEPWQLEDVDERDFFGGDEDW